MKMLNADMERLSLVFGVQLELRELRDKLQSEQKGMKRDHTALTQVYICMNVSVCI